MKRRSFAAASLFAAAMLVGSAAFATEHPSADTCAHVESMRGKGKSNSKIAKILKISEAQVRDCVNMSAGHSHTSSSVAK